MIGINPTTTQYSQPQAGMQARNCNCENCVCHRQEISFNDLQDSFTRQGIIPPRDYKPDPFAGLGKPVEMTPEERLKKKWEDIRRPMYISEEIQTTSVKPVGQDMQAYTVKTVQVITPKTQEEKEEQQNVSQPAEKPTFVQKVKNFFKKIFRIK